jgi:DNA polymerase III epsilon subunit-like protein
MSPKQTYIYDLETCGYCPLPVSSSFNRVLQICAYCVESGEMFTAFVEPGLAGGIPPQSTALHHISDADIAGSADFTTVVDDMFVALGREPGAPVELIAHNNTKFDELVFRREYKGVLGPEITFWDTLPFMRRVYPRLSSYGLGALYYHFYNTNFENAHRADADVLALTRLYKDKVLPKRVTDGTDVNAALDAECLCIIPYIGPYRAGLIYEKMNIESVSRLKIHFQKEVLVDPLALDDFLKKEIGIRTAQHRIFVIAHVLDIKEPGIFSRRVAEDCFDVVDYYHKYRFVLNRPAPRPSLYYQGLQMTRLKES